MTKIHQVDGALVCGADRLTPEDREWIGIEVARLRTFGELVSHRLGVDVLNTLPEWREFLGLPDGYEVARPMAGGRAPDVQRRIHGR